MSKLFLITQCVIYFLVLGIYIKNLSFDDAIVISEYDWNFMIVFGYIVIGIFNLQLAIMLYYFGKEAVVIISK